MFKIVSLLLLVVLVSFNCSAFYLESDQENRKVSGWEHVFAYNISSVIPLHHYGPKSYYLGIGVKAKYMQAMQFCDNIHMKLLTIRSREENDRIQKYIREANKGSDDFWTSGSKLLDGRNWVWMSHGDGIQYTNWAPGEPNDDRSQCIRLSSKHGELYWHDSRCDESRFFICERYSASEDVTGVDTEPTITGWMQMLTGASSNIGLLHYNNKRYFFARNFKTNYLQAIQFCNIIKMELVTISSAEENDRIHKYIRDISVPGPFWTSGRKIDSVWTWPIGSQQLSYANWARDQPSFKTNKKCIEIDHDGEWLDENCYERRHFICEMPTGPRSGNIADSRKMSVSQCSTEPVINVYISNNVITENGREEVSQSFLTSKDVEISETGYHVHVSNNIETPGSEKNNEI